VAAKNAAKKLFFLWRKSSAVQFVINGGNLKVEKSKLEGRVVAFLPPLQSVVARRPLLGGVENISVYDGYDKRLI
jgi:hypothetical protein